MDIPNLLDENTKLRKALDSVFNFVDDDDMSEARAAANEALR